MRQVGFAVVVVTAAAMATLTATATVAHADGKSGIAVLGVMPKDPDLVRTADAMTAAIRARAGAKSSTYKVTGTRKEVDAAILSAECSSIQPACAAKLGTTLAAEYAIAGELEQRGTHQILVLSLVDVGAKQRIRAVRQIGLTTANAKKMARDAYTRLIDGDAGALSIVANAASGEVYIDGQNVAALFKGRTTIDGLVNGTHQLQIRANGYRPFEIDVTIEYATEETVLLEPE